MPERPTGEASAVDVDGGGREDWGLLVPVGSVDPFFLDFLSLILPESIGFPFKVAERPLAADGSYDAVRQQWNASRILEELDHLTEGQRARKVLGIIDHDLFIPILTFVFGLAHLGARCAVVSLHRLRSEFYGLPEDQERLLSRLEREAIHELGHTLNLKHCSDYGCVMHYANAVEEVDLKMAAFCPSCRREAGRAST